MTDDPSMPSFPPVPGEGERGRPEPVPPPERRRLKRPQSSRQPMTQSGAPSGGSIPPPPLPPPPPPPQTLRAQADFDPTLKRGGVNRDHASSKPRTVVDPTIPRSGPRTGRQPESGSDSGFDPTMKRGRGTAPLPPNPNVTPGRPPTAPLPPRPSIAGWQSLDERLQLGEAAVVDLVEDGVERETPSQAGLPTPDRYRHIGEIARGGMGVIRRVVDHDLGREVAMKVILDLPDEDSIVRFIREARIGGQLEHPGIPPVHELGLDATGNLYFTMKFVRGESLAQRLKTLREDLLAGRGDDGFPLVQRLEVFKKVCDAMAFAHAHGVIHRDLKPDNIMVGRFGEVLVMDWGLARLPGTAEGGGRASEPGEMIPDTLVNRGPSTVSEAVQTLQGDILGTPAYMAPEQARGQVDKMDARTDVYALGTILYEMLTLRRAHEGKTVYELLAASTEGRITPPAERLRTDPELSKTALRVPPELDAIVRKAIQRRQHARYSGCPELKHDIEQYESGGMVGAAQYSSWQRTVRFVRRHRKSLAAAAVVMICAAIAVVAALRAAEDAREALLQENLAAHGDTLENAEAVLAGIRSRVQAGEARGALADTDAFERDFTEPLEQVALDDLVREHRPEWSERSRALPAELVELRVAAATRIVNDALDSLPPPDKATADAAVMARERFLEYRAEWGQTPAMESVPVASLALWLARYHHGLRENDEMRRWIGETWATGPGSAAGCEAIELLAATNGSRNDRLGSVMQLHRALSAARSEAARYRLMMNLAERLAVLNGPTPYANRVPAREMAARNLLRIVTPTGELRPAAKAALADQVEEIRQRAGLLLTILRRIVSITSESLNRIEGSDPARFFEIVDDHVEVVGVEPPDEPGAGQWKLTPVTRMPLAPLRAQTSAAPTTDGGFIPATETTPPIVYFDDEKRDTELQDSRLYVLVLDRLSASPRVVSQLVVAPTPVQSGGHAMVPIPADVDNDGICDLIIREIYGWSSVGVVRVAFGRRNGSFGEPRLLHQPNDVGSLHKGIFVRDFDGDGQNELLVCRGAWNHFCLDMYRIGRDRRLPATPIAREYRAPESTTIVEDRDGRPVLLMTSDVRPGPDRFFAFRQIPRPDFGLFALRFDGTKFVDAMPPLVGPNGRGFVHMSGPYDLNDGRQALVVGSPSAFRWLIYDQPLPHGTVVDNVQLDTMVWLGDGKWIRDRQGRLARPLSDEDLDVLGTQPLHLRDEAAGDPAVQMARFLLDVGLAASAAEVAKVPAEQRNQRNEAAFELTRLRLRGLLASAQIDELVSELRSLEPVEDLAPTVRDMLAALLLRHRKVAAVAGIASRWAQGGDLNALRRAQFKQDSERWKDLIERVKSPRVEVRGRTVWEQGEATRDIAEVVVASRPGILTIENDPGTGEPNWVVNTTNHRADAWIEQDPGQRDGMHWRATNGERIDTAGVPVVFHGDYLRVTFEFRIDSGATNAFIQVGIHTLRNFPSNGKSKLLTITDGWAQGLRARVWVRGHNDRYGHAVGWVGDNTGLVHIDSIEDRWVRIDLEYLAEAGNARLIVADPQTNEVLHHVTYRGLPAPGGGLGVLGVRTLANEGVPSSNAVYRIRRIAACGEVQLAQPDDPDLVMLVNRTSSGLVTLAERATMRGDRQLAGQLLRTLADRYEKIIAVATPEQAQMLGKSVNHLKMESVLREAPDQLAPIIAPLFQQPGGADVILEWLVNLPSGTERARAAWRQVGLAYARWRSGNSTDPAGAMRQYLLQAARGNRLSYHDAMVVPWLVEQYPRDDATILLGLVALATGTVGQVQGQGQQGQLPLYMRDVIGRQLLALGMQHEDVIGREPGLARVYLGVLARERKREHLLKLAAKLPAQVDSDDVITLTRDLMDEHEKQLARARREVATSPVAFPEFPGDERDDERDDEQDDD